MKAPGPSLPGHAALGQAISIEVAWMCFVIAIAVDTSLQ